MPLQPSQPTIAILLLLASAKSADALAAGDHEHLFVDFCTLITLNKRQFPDLPNTQQATTDYQQIQKLNASLSNHEWRNKFGKTGEGDARHPYKPADGKEDDLHKKRWASWTAAEAELEKEDPPKHTLKAAQLEFSTESQRLQYLASLQSLAEQAAVAVDELQTVQENSTKLTATELKNELKSTSFGAGIANENQLTEDNIKANNNAATTRKNLCGDTTASEKAQTIAAFIYCICAGESTDGSGNVKYCESSQADNNNAGTGLTGVDTATKNLISKCPDASTEEISSAELLTLAAQFQAKIKTKGTAAYFGDFTANDCGGASASGVCVYYKSGTKAEQQATRDIPWLQTIKQVATKLQQQQSATKRLGDLVRLIADIKGQAFNLKPQLELHKNLAQAMAQTATAAVSSAQTQGQQKKNQCDAINKATQCREKQPTCEWKGKNDDDGEHFKLIEIHETQQETQQEQEQQHQKLDVLNM